jgi:hypothetical protein
MLAHTMDSRLQLDWDRPDIQLSLWEEGRLGCDFLVNLCQLIDSTTSSTTSWTSSPFTSTTHSLDHTYFINTAIDIDSFLFLLRSPLNNNILQFQLLLGAKHIPNQPT